MWRLIGKDLVAVIRVIRVVRDFRGGCKWPCFFFSDPNYEGARSLALKITSAFDTIHCYIWCRCLFFKRPTHRPNRLDLNRCHNRHCENKKQLIFAYRRVVREGPNLVFHSLTFFLRHDLGGWIPRRLRILSSHAMLQCCCATRNETWVMHLL